MLTILLLLQIKHWYIDFVAQTPEQIACKGIYGHPKGIEHAFWHGALTAIILSIVLEPSIAILLGLADLLLHYHIDYVKMQYGCKDPSNKKYWRDFGLDQLAHQITYILIFSLIGVYGTAFDG